MAENDNAIWSDLNRDGRRLERIIKDMHTKMYPTEEDKDGNIINIDIPTDLFFSYLDRLLKSTHEKVLIVDRVLAVKKILREADKLEYARA